MCIVELEQMFAKFVKEKGIDEVVIGNVVIMLMLLADDMMDKSFQEH